MNLKNEDRLTANIKCSTVLIIGIFFFFDQDTSVNFIYFIYFIYFFYLLEANYFRDRGLFEEIIAKLF